MGKHDQFDDAEGIGFQQLSDMLQGARGAPFRSRGFPKASDFSPVPTAAPDPNAKPDPAPEPEIDLDAVRAHAHKKGFTEGFAQGYQQGQAEATPVEDPAALEATAQMVEARTMFTELARALSAETETYHSSLKKSLESAVITLATDLAGSQIDFLPEGFAAKIETLAERITSDVEQTEVVLNAEDMAVIRPALDHSEALEGCVMKTDTNLRRGELEIRSGPNRVRTTLPDVTDEAPE